LTGTVTISTGVTINFGRCATFLVTATGVSPGNFVVLKGPTQLGWIAAVASTGTDQIAVRMCNMTGGNVSPNGIQLLFAAISPIAQ
jgi:hypothetical protein